MVAGRAFARSAASTEVRVLGLLSTASRAPRARSRCALPSARVASPIAVVVVVAALKKITERHRRLAELRCRSRRTRRSHRGLLPAQQARARRFAQHVGLNWACDHCQPAATLVTLRMLVTLQQQCVSRPEGRTHRLWPQGQTPAGTGSTAATWPTTSRWSQGAKVAVGGSRIVLC